MELTPKQLLFVKEYIKDFNGKQAAIRAGYTKRSAESTSSTLLSYPKVAEAIRAKTSKQDATDDELRRKVKAQLAVIAFAKLSDFGTINEHGFSLSDNFSDLDPMLQSVVREWTVNKNNTGTNVRIKLSSQEKALELLGRHLGMYTDKVDIKVVEPTIIEFKDGRKIEMGMTPSQGEDNG